MFRSAVDDRSRTCSIGGWGERLGSGDFTWVVVGVDKYDSTPCPTLVVKLYLCRAAVCASSKGVVIDVLMLEY